MVVRRSETAVFKEPHCYHGKNRKSEVVAFTCIESIYSFFELLSGLISGQVKKYFKRKLKSATRQDHPVKVIASENKQFALVYKFSTGTLSIEFSYGEWNIFGFPQTPQHPCQLDNQEQ